MPPAPETTEANAARSGKAAAEEIMNKTASAEADQGVDETPAKPIHSGRAILPPLPPTRPSSLGSASAKSASRQAMN